MNNMIKIMMKTIMMVRVMKIILLITRRRVRKTKKIKLQIKIRGVKTNMLALARRIEAYLDRIHRRKAHKEKKHHKEE